MYRGRRRVQLRRWGMRRRERQSLLQGYHSQPHTFCKQALNCIILSQRWKYEVANAWVFGGSVEGQATRANSNRVAFSWLAAPDRNVVVGER